MTTATSTTDIMVVYTTDTKATPITTSITNTTTTTNNSSKQQSQIAFFFKKKTKNAQNQRAKLIFSKWVNLLLHNFGLFQQVFENLKLNKLVKEERRLDLEDRIWRLKFGKTQFWSCILKNEFESLYFLKG